jgi:hypothetical protein
MFACQFDAEHLKSQSDQHSLASYVITSAAVHFLQD